MATLCKNCATPLVFDPTTQKVVCPTCGSSWYAEEVESEEKKYKTEKPVSRSEVFGVDKGVKDEFLDCYVYTCGSCGGEININGSEVSTKCIYCGSSSVVFSRISREKAPEFIIPFQVTRDQALNLIRHRFSHGMFIPKEVKNFEPTAVRGIYIPFWLVDAKHFESDIVSTEVRKGKNHYETYYFEKSGKLLVRNLPVDASLMLSDESSQRLEPFHFADIKIFDEDYLLGFYSNVSDIHVKDLNSAVHARVSEAFRQQVLESVQGSNQKVVFYNSETLIDRDLRYVLLPVWFVTYNFRGRHNTIMVNGQTGKLVCGIPWNEKAFTAVIAGVSALLTPVMALLYKYMVFPLITTLLESKSRDSGKAAFYLIALFGALVIGAFSAALKRFRRVKKQLQLSQSDSIFNFMKKRQG